MSLQSVRQFFADHAPDIDIITLNQSAAAPGLTAAAPSRMEPGQSAKTLALEVKHDIILIVAKGDARLDNQKLKAVFGAKARMLSSDEVVNWTGHPASGVCPFGLENPLAVFCDISLRPYADVLLVAGAAHSVVRLSPARMAELTHASWVDVCL